MPVDQYCYKCGDPRHYVNACPHKMQQNQQGHKQNPPQQQQTGRNGGNQQNKTPWQGKVNHVTAESVAEASDVLLGTFTVASSPATVLFGTGATHAFIAKSFSNNIIYT